MEFLQAPPVSPPSISEPSLLTALFAILLLTCSATFFFLVVLHVLFTRLRKNSAGSSSKSTPWLTLKRSTSGIEASRKPIDTWISKPH